MTLARNEVVIKDPGTSATSMSDGPLGLGGLRRKMDVVTASSDELDVRSCE